MVQSSKINEMNPEIMKCDFPEIQKSRFLIYAHD